MDDSRAFILGFGTFALGGILGKYWSPDYYESCASGSIFFLVLGFSIIVFIGTLLIDVWFKKVAGDHKCEKPAIKGSET